MSFNNSTTFGEYRYCNLTDFKNGYEQIHGTLSVLVCVFGSVANVLNVCVLTTKEMRWPTNLILTGLAVADLLVMLDYIPFAFERYILDRKFINMYTYNWAQFTVFHALFSQICHFVSCCLTVILAVCRLVTITLPQVSRKWITIKNTVVTIVITYIVCTLICYPVFLSIDIQPYNQSCDVHGKMIDKDETHNYNKQDVYVKQIYVTRPNEYWGIVSFWIYGVIIKLIPCILLTILSAGLIYVLLQTKKRRKKLLCAGQPMKSLNSASASKPILGNKKVDQDRQADRTSTMLLAVLLLFLITEFPQAILGLLSVSIGKQFEEQCYTPLGDIMDILALTNSAINFILYCIMSRQFRATFHNFFWPKICRGWICLTHRSSSDKSMDKTQLSQV